MSLFNSSKSRFATLIFAVFFGGFGLHRFYVGKFWTGILMFLTGGGFIVWWVVDCILILLGVFTDKDGRPVSDW